ncbi:hypothetical protein YPPY71_2609, partial [Yersinia pestis PY-71]
MQILAVPDRLAL